MTWIEGIGDEVTHFFLVIVLVSVGLIAWWSTSISEQPLIRTTVLILERRSRHRAPAEAVPLPSTTTTSVNSSIDTGQAGGSLNTDENQEDMQGATCQTCNKDSNVTPQLSDVASSVGSTSSSERVASPDLEVSITSSDTCNQEGFQPTIANVSGNSHSQVDNLPTATDIISSTLRRRRLAFFQSRHETLLESPVDDRQGSNHEGASGTELSTEERDLRTPDTAGNHTATEDVTAAGNIRIRLKYLNDDQKLVEGRLHEQLGDFKRRHFGLELAADKLVRLIFNGQVLQSDSQTLQGYGLFDNCVVHCLVHQQRSGGGAPPPEGTHSNPPAGEGSAQHRDWDLGNILFASLSILLGLAWYCRYQYSQLFSATSTVGLVGLTGILTVSLIGLYFPDQDGVRH